MIRLFFDTHSRKLKHISYIINTHHRLKPKDRSERRARQRERRARKREKTRENARKREKTRDERENARRARERETSERRKQGRENEGRGGERAPKNLDARKASHPFLTIFDFFQKKTVRKTKFFPTQATAKIRFVLHSIYKGDIPYQVWFNLNNSLTR